MFSADDLPFLAFDETTNTFANKISVHHRFCFVVQCRLWMKNGPGENIVMPLRFMGTSPDSSSLIPMLTSLCEQISINYDQNVDDIPDEVRM